jgi:hypothetical protein
MSLKSSIFRLLQLGCVTYLATALVYTTNHLVISPVSSVLSRMVATRFPTPQLQTYTSLPHHHRVDLVARALQASHAQHLDSDAALASSSPWDFTTSDDLLYWAGYENSDTTSTSDSVPTSLISETTFLSKAFAQSSHPTKIIPFYYKASAPVDDTDVTITTLVTSNRYKVLRQLVERYRGEYIPRIYTP